MAESIKGVTVLGATGSIGVSTLDVLARHADRYRIVALSANTQVDRLLEQCLAHKPRYAVMVDANAAEQLANQLRDKGSDTEVLSGVEGLERRPTQTAVQGTMVMPGSGAVPAAGSGKAPPSQRPQPASQQPVRPQQRKPEPPRKRSDLQCPKCKGTKVIQRISSFQTITSKKS